jgi:hypothetical protein
MTSRRRIFTRPLAKFRPKRNEPHILVLFSLSISTRAPSRSMIPFNLFDTSQTIFFSLSPFLLYCTSTCYIFILFFAIVFDLVFMYTTFSRYRFQSSKNFIQRLIPSTLNFFFLGRHHQSWFTSLPSFSFRFTPFFPLLILILAVLALKPLIVPSVHWLSDLWVRELRIRSGLLSWL